MSHNRFGGVPAPRRAPRDFFALTGVAFPRAGNKPVQSLLPFPIPNLLRDSLLGMYLTPVLAKIHPDATVQRLYYDVRAYLVTLRDTFALARGGDRLALARAHRMLAWPEANELRYGYAAEGSMGTGLGGGKLHHLVFDTLMKTPALLDVAIFAPDIFAMIPLISLDRMGDFVGSVGKDAVIAHTQKVMRLYFPNSDCVRLVDVPGCWDPVAQNWVTRRVELPVADDGRAILLPHKKTVRSSPPLRAQQFARYIGRGEMDKPSVIAYVQANPTKLLSFAEDVLKDEWRYLPRRIFRD